MSALFDIHLQTLEDISVSRKEAVIREAECIGCTKCITACPVDAILGGAKQMHTVIAVECTGCELCVAPCPVDCIDIIPRTEKDSVTERAQKLNQFKQRYIAHEKRLQQETQQERNLNRNSFTIISSQTDKKAYIQAALQRVKNKKK